MPARMYPGTPVLNEHGQINPGEEEVFKCLKEKLPENWIVMHSVRENRANVNYEADFVILIPHKGILFIEVKSNNPNNIRVNNGVWEISVKNKDTGKYYWKPMDKGSPLEQVFLASKQFMKARMNDNTFAFWMNEFSSARELFSQIRYTSAVILTRVTELPKGGSILHNEEAKNELFSPETHYICGLTRMTSSNLEQIFLSYFNAPKKLWKSDWFGEEQMQAIRRKVKPCCDFGLDPTAFNLMLENSAAKVNTIMEGLADSWGDVIVRGCAGSGKTVMMCREVRRLVNQQIRGKDIPSILVLCYNSELAQELKNQLKAARNLGNVNVKSFHSFAHDELMKLTSDTYDVHNKISKVPKNQIQIIWEQATQEFLKNLVEKGAPNHYDHVFIDEAQDFEDLWLSCLRYYYASDYKRNYTRGRVYYFCDSNQTIFSGRGAIEEEEDPPIQIRLKHNLRNALQIAHFNSRCLSGVAPESMPIALPSFYGKPVCIKDEADVLERRIMLEELVLELTEKEGVNKNDIVVLSPYKQGNQNNSFGDIKSKVRMACTIRKFKGLEADYVILTDVVPCNKKDDVQSFADFYVAATRARYALYIFPAIGGKAQLDAWLNEAEQTAGESLVDIDEENI